MIALRVRRVVNMSFREGSGAPMILPVVVSTAPTPHSDAAGENALDGSPVAPVLNEMLLEVLFQTRTACGL